VLTRMQSSKVTELVGVAKYAMKRSPETDEHGGRHPVRSDVQIAGEAPRRGHTS
jgi:hypothetical protein